MATLLLCNNVMSQVDIQFFHLFGGGHTLFSTCVKFLSMGNFNAFGSFAAHVQDKQYCAYGYINLLVLLLLLMVLALVTHIYNVANFALQYWLNQLRNLLQQMVS